MVASAGAAAEAAVGGALEGTRLGKLLGDYGSEVVARFTGSTVQSRLAARGDDHAGKQPWRSSELTHFCSRKRTHPVVHQKAREAWIAVGAQMRRQQPSTSVFASARRQGFAAPGFARP